jgi:hypothetical protein
MKKLLLVLLVFSLPGVLLAQQGQTGLNGLQFVSPLQISAGVDDNFLVDRTNPNERLLVLSLPASVQPAAPSIKPLVLDDKVFMVTLPRVAYQNDGRRHQFVASWLGEVELFKQNSDQNSFNQQATASFSYDLAHNLQVMIADSFQSTKDPARALSNVFLLLPRSRYHENDISGSLEYQPSPLTNVSVRYDTGYARFGQTDPFQSRILDSTSSGVSVSLTRMLGRHQRLRGTYSLFTITAINQQSTFDDAVDRKRAFEHPISSGTVEYRVGLNPATVVSVSGGLIGLENGKNYIFGGNIYRRIGYYFIASGGYSRSLAFLTPTASGFAQGLGANGFYDSILVRFEGQTTAKTAVHFDMTMARDASNRLSVPSKALLGRSRFDYRLSDSKVLFASWETFQQTQNVYVLAPLTRNRIMGGIEISLSSETQRRTNTMNEDGQYVALTDHGRRRKSPEED